MKRLCGCAALLLAASLLLPAEGVKSKPQNAKSLSLVGRPAPEFHLPDFEEGAFDLASSGGHIVLLSFWASWCSPCRAEMPTLAKLQKDLSAENVDVVLVTLDDPAKAQRFLKKAHLEARCLADEKGNVKNLYGVRAIPRAFVIDREGTVRHVLFGKHSETQLRKAIASARE